MTNTVTTTVEPPDRTTTWAWDGRSPPGHPTETHRQRDDATPDHPETEPVEQ